MASKTVEIKVDDLNGVAYSEGETVAFVYEGIRYELDLSKRNAETFHKTMGKYTKKARKVKGSPTYPSYFGYPKLTSNQSFEVRKWGKANHYKVTNRGRIPHNILRAYIEAHPESGIVWGE